MEQDLSNRHERTKKHRDTDYTTAIPFKTVRSQANDSPKQSSDLKQAKSWEQQRQDVRWQKKANEIYERENWTCEMCSTNQNRLTVHHSFYVPGLAMWEYPNESMHCLCWPCHQQAQAIMWEVQRQIGCLRLSQIERLNRGLKAFMESAK